MAEIHDNDGPKGENGDQYQNLTQQISILQTEKKKTEEEFSLQRAKMKDLILQKEADFKQQLVDQETKLTVELKRLQTELDDCQSQLTVRTLEFQSKLEGETRKYREELSSLQHLLNETVEENNRYEKANQELKLAHANLLNELGEIKATKEMDENSGADIPQILSVPSTVISSLARKITTLSSSSSVPVASSSPILSQVLDTDTLDDSMRKVNKYAQEDAAVLRSLVVPLEEEIEALKEKIREMDAELRRYKQSSVSKKPGERLSNFYLFIEFKEHVSPSIVEKSHSTSCEMCTNYEAQLLNAQGKIHDLEKHIMSLERYKQELCKETTFRKEMEAKWNEKKEEYKLQVSSLLMKTCKAEETIRELRATFSNTYDDVTRQLMQLCIDRENNQKELNRLLRENDNLVGKYSKHSQQLQNEVINLPDNVEDLQELILRYQEELISAKIAKESADETVSALMKEMNSLRDQSRSKEQSRLELENTLTENMNKLKNDVHQMSWERNRHIEAFQDLDRNNASLKDELNNCNVKLEKLFKSKKQAEDTINELRSRISSLQMELDNSEKVQKDFVLLSQSLQQELEKIRGAETEVRWEHEEDVNDCRRCKNMFSVTRRKLHCLHCGRIFCSPCLTHTVHSGPNSRPSKVCDVCHTLLVRDSAPYFSTVPPQGNCSWCLLLGINKPTNANDNVIEG
ncbi:hypothetical protein V9T40_004290 [Parthenolecanium corni]|uniref:FYVE-type domain-containing protein n=1 Tax=Parthenolecanium corni TaxID=536013 RepID=A0AAN9TUM7_9HEMI